ncbi:MAG: choice-of-anchor B family protein [Haliscomenobacter sp.]|nr:choice-of-anchor B family protein [Haliscomenobacter sp.]
MNTSRFLPFLALSVWHLPVDGQNISLLANVNDFPQTGYSDVWGYVDKKGLEYAVLGARSGTAIYSLANPRAPKLAAFVPGANSIWRDMKSHGEYIYAVADQGADGILAIDMSKAPDTITWKFHKPVIGSIPLNKCHNLYIDEKGRLFLSGCNINNGGVLIFDGASAPGTPLYLGGVNTRYSHDNFTRNDTLWSADVYLGEFSVADVSNPRAPRLLATQPTSSRFTHNCWLSDDGKYLFTTDEKTFGTVDAFDVSNIDDIEFLDRFSPKGAKENRAIPHNTHYHKGFLATSWYTEGVVLTDAHRPQNLIETGRYDTYPQSKQGFEGCWGAYPYLPSGLLLASDISTGLYVLQPQYRLACYLEGAVRDKTTNLPVAGAQVRTLSEDIAESTDLEGVFRGGRVQPGIVTVVIAAGGYLSDTLEVELQPGVVKELNILLEKEGTTPTSTREMARHLKYELLVSPNPCSENCQAILSQPLTEDRAQLEIWNRLGQRVASIPAAKGNSQFLLTFPGPPGMYWVRLHRNGQTLGVETLVRNGNVAR